MQSSTKRYAIVKETDYPNEGYHAFIIADMNSDGTMYPFWPLYDSLEAVKKELPADCPGHHYFHVVTFIDKVPDQERNHDINENDIEWDPEQASHLKKQIYKQRFLEEVVPKLEGRDMIIMKEHLKSGGDLTMRG